MQFLIRLVEYVGLFLVVFSVFLMSVTLIVFVINRGLQLFFALFGYEIGDFFSWFMKKLGFRKIKKEENESVR